MYFDSYHKINNSPQKYVPITELQFHLIDSNFGAVWNTVDKIHHVEEINQLVIHLNKEELIKFKKFIDIMIEKEKTYKEGEIIEAEV